MATIYHKDLETGIIATSIEAVVDYTTAGGVASRNAMGRVFLPGNTPYQVIVQARGKQTVIASGTTKSSAGKMAPVFVRVRAEAPAEEPSEPVEPTEAVVLRGLPI